LTTSSSANTAGFSLAGDAVTVSQAGTYLISPGVLLNNDASGVSGGVADLRVNGTSVPGTAMQFENGLFPSSTFASCSVVVALNAGDVVSIANAAGVAITVGGSPPAGTTKAGDVATLTIAKLG
jgi:hypothetical protein